MGPQGGAVPSLPYQLRTPAPSEVSWAVPGTVTGAGNSPAVPQPGRRAAAGPGLRARPQGAWRPQGGWQPRGGLSPAPLSQLQRPPLRQHLPPQGSLARHCGAKGPDKGNALTSLQCFGCQAGSKGGLKSLRDDHWDGAGMFPFTKAASLTEPGGFHSGGGSQ